MVAHTFCWRIVVKAVAFCCADVLHIAVKEVAHNHVSVQIGVDLDEKGGVKVDDFSQSNVPSIWAIGDVSNRIPLTPVARMEGTYFAQHLFGCATLLAGVLPSAQPLAPPSCPLPTHGPCCLVLSHCHVSYS